MRSSPREALKYYPFEGVRTFVRINGLTHKVFGQFVFLFASNTFPAFQPTHGARPRDVLLLVAHLVGEAVLDDCCSSRLVDLVNDAQNLANGR